MVYICSPINATSHNSSSVSVGHRTPNDHILKSEETVGHFSHNSGHNCDVHAEGIANDL